jgi:hypothetical protein
LHVTWKKTVFPLSSLARRATSSSIVVCQDLSSSISPYDVAMQQRIVGAALDLLETATAPRTSVTMPLAWTKGDAWKETVFTPEQPFLSGDQVKNWEARKQRYREQKT